MLFELDKKVTSLWKSSAELPSLVIQANLCALHETCGSSPTDGRSGMCDSHFVALRDFLSHNLTAPRQSTHLLQPDFVDSIQSCRKVLREVPVHNLNIHEDYQRVHPAIKEVVLTKRQNGFLNTFRSLCRIVRFSDPLKSIGLEVKESAGEDDGLIIAGVARNSLAQQSGLDQHVGDIITHVCNMLVKTRADAVGIVQRNLTLSVWVEQRARSNSSAAGKEDPRAVKRGPLLQLQAVAT
eukprot:TRINITY_DN75844_c0_g1_i1.p1 TRINITY_DN75844_c0_g1~~TRINITY_DN75844_c0_g1_i1.p1  ORF type:complete len:259 (-),score=45.95 TRINITY_DN75844_c0_g1_i1:179-895(-)